MVLLLYSLEETKTSILPELVELTNDEHSHVRLAGLETVVSILSLLDAGLSVCLLSLPFVCAELVYSSIQQVYHPDGSRP